MRPNDVQRVIRLTLMGVLGVIIFAVHREKRSETRFVSQRLSARVAISANDIRF